MHTACPLGKPLREGAAAAAGRAPFISRRRPHMVCPLGADQERRPPADAAERDPRPVSRLDTETRALAKRRGLCVESGANAQRDSAARPGDELPQWARAIVAGVRSRIPEIRATRKGSRLVILRLGDREARLEDDGGAFVIRFGRPTPPCMSGLSIATAGTRTRRRRWRIRLPVSSTQSSRARKIRKSGLLEFFPHDILG